MREKDPTWSTRTKPNPNTIIQCDTLCIESIFLFLSKMTRKLQGKNINFSFCIFFLLLFQSSCFLFFLCWLLGNRIFVFVCTIKREPPCCFLIQSKDVPVRSYTRKENVLKYLETTDLIVWREDKS